MNLLGGAGTSYLADAGNPYGQFFDHTGTGLPLPAGMNGAPEDIGFGTFGAPVIATLVTETATRALKHQWYQKWLVHRRLRPEEFGGHVEVQRLERATYPFHPDLLQRLLPDSLRRYNNQSLKRRSTPARHRPPTGAALSPHRPPLTIPAAPRRESRRPAR
ncbi:MAG: hypothetical protein ACRDR6_19710 [Pseudonocardiaceae bacterium]